MTAAELVAIMADPNSSHIDVKKAWYTYHIAALGYLPSKCDHWVDIRELAKGKPP